MTDHDNRFTDDGRLFLWVLGEAIPQGSKTRTPQGGMIEGNTRHHQKLGDWRHGIATAARATLQTDNPGFIPWNGPIMLGIVFYLPRPKSANKRRFPTGKPDASKLTRAVEDALKGIVYTDDARIVRLVIDKRYADGGPPGVSIAVWELAADEVLP